MVSSSASATSNYTATTSGSTSTSSGSSSGSAPKPMPVAIMRNAHEVIRGAMKDIQDLLDKDEFEAACALWHRFHRFSDLHMHMEEGSTKANAGGLFKLVDDHADNAAKKQGLRHHHSNLYELEEDVVDVFENAPDIQRAKDIYPIFRQENEEHLKEEENILMPAIQKMMKNGVNVKKYIKKDIMPILLHQEGDLEFFLRFGNEVLERHDNAPDKPRVRVFDHAFWALASKEEWAKWKVWIQDSLSPEKYAELDAAIAAFEEEQAAKKKSRTQEKLAKETPPLTSINTQPKRSLLAIVFGKAAA